MITPPTTFTPPFRRAQVTPREANNARCTCADPRRAACPMHDLHLYALCAAKHRGNELASGRVA